MRIAGVDIGGTSIKLGVFEDDVLLSKSSVKTPFDDPEAVVGEIARTLDGQGVSLVGVGTAGSVHTDDGTVFASNLGWEGVPLRAMLEAALHLPVYVDNDAQAALMAEWQAGACTGVQTALYLTLGTGIGGAMIIGGRPFRGKNNLGAEFGHMIICADGPRCSCGRRGCLEYYASATGLRRMANGISAREIIAKAKAGHPQMRGIFEAYVQKLAIGLNNLIMAYDPEVIVLGGGISGAGGFLAESCQTELRRLFADTTDPLLCEIRIARHQNDAGIIGAAIMAEYHLT